MMKIKSIIKLVTLLLIFTIIGFTVSKFTYDQLKSRTRTIFYITTDDFLVDPSLGRVLQFNTILNLVIDRFSNDLSSENSDLCPIKPAGDMKPIDLIFNNNTNIYSIIMLDNSYKNIDKCFESILTKTTEGFHDQVSGLISLLERGEGITQKILRAEESLSSIRKTRDDEMRTVDRRYENLYLTDETKINFSELINLLDNKQIQEMGIGIDFVVGTTYSGETFYTVSKGYVKSPVILKKLTDTETNFYIINEDYSKIRAAQQFNTNRQLSIKVKRALYKDLLTKVPYIFLNKETKAFKISPRSYALIIMLLSNLIALITFFCISKEFRNTVISTYKNITQDYD